MSGKIGGWVTEKIARLGGFGDYFRSKSLSTENFSGNFGWIWL